jgi:hypothetical protein
MSGRNERAERQLGAIKNSEQLQNKTRRTLGLGRISSWQPLSSITTGFFSVFIIELDRRAAADPEPAKRFFPTWEAWQRRHWELERLRSELREAGALTTYPEDPAPLASEGLPTFMAWAIRQEQRRRFRQ